MKSNDAIIRLQSAPLYFEPRTAAAYVNANGKCEYCDCDLIHSRLGYACAQIDHLLPQGKFPYEITGQHSNFVLSCSLCNGIKRDDNVLRVGEDPFTMLETNRAELLVRAKELINKRLEDANKKWVYAKAIFTELSGASS